LPFHFHYAVCQIIESKGGLKMLAHFIEASVMFQNGTVYAFYGIIFGTLGVIALVGYISACKNQNK